MIRAAQDADRAAQEAAAEEAAAEEAAPVEAAPVAAAPKEAAAEEEPSTAQVVRELRLQRQAVGFLANRELARAWMSWASSYKR
jgi:hypothetical protein